MTIVLFRRPGTVCVLDRDEDLLALVASGLRPYWRTRAFADPDAFAEHLQNEAAFAAADRYEQQQCLARGLAGSNLPAEILGYWARQTERFALTRVAVLDHQAVSPVTHTLGLPQEWHIATIVLNTSLAYATDLPPGIDRALSKEDPRFLQRTQWLVGELMDGHDAKTEADWRRCLTAQQLAALSAPVAVASLQPFLDRLFTEYAVCGDPFGVLGLTQHGLTGWVQLSIGKPVDKISDAQLLKSLGLSLQAHVADPIAFERGGLYGACFLIDRALGALPRTSTFRAWRRSAPD